MAHLKETALYLPIKAMFEQMGYEVKSEITEADVVAHRNGEWLIIEMKTGFTLKLLHQASKRQKLCDNVFVAVPKWRGRSAWRVFKENVALCKQLGLGVISIDMDTNSPKIHHQPRSYTPRKNRAKFLKLQKEFMLRDGDPNLGGMKAGGRVTAYRQQAEKCRLFLEENGPSKSSTVAEVTGIQSARKIMYDNHYGWFERQARGIYATSQK